MKKFKFRLFNKENMAFLPVLLVVIFICVSNFTMGFFFCNSGMQFTFMDWIFNALSLLVYFYCLFLLFRWYGARCEEAMLEKAYSDMEEYFLLVKEMREKFAVVLGAKNEEIESLKKKLEEQVKES